jgi:TonB family protein
VRTNTSLLRGMLLVSMLASVSSTRVVAREAEETLASARELYASAAYEDALVILNRLRINATSDDQLPIDQYRAFCLLALGRTQDAVQAIEAVVTARPTYQPADSEVSPRIRSAFTDVRRRLLPGLIESRYATAKAAFDRKEFSTAATGFKQVLEALSDPDVSVAAGKPPLSDIKTLSAGFFDLSTAAAAVVAAAAPPPPPPPVAVPPPAPIPTASPAPVAVAAAASAVPRVYGTEDPGIVAPVPVRQVLPEYQKPPIAIAAAGKLMAPPNKGMLEIVVDERGAVENAIMRISIQPAYDAQILEATKSWKYKPATKDGAPVKYRKYITINVKL